MSPLPILIGAIAAVVLWQVIRRPVQRRLALRDATRRPAETMLVIAGSLLGTALITGSFIVGDTLDSSIRAGAYTQLGPVDEVIQAPHAKAARIYAQVIEEPERDLVQKIGRILQKEAERDVEEFRGTSLPEGATTGFLGFAGAEPDDLPGLVDGVLTATTVPASTSTRTEPRRGEPGSQLLEVDFEAAADFGGDPSVTGIQGATPSPGEAAITDDLAGKLGIGEGDPFAAFAYDKRLDLTVDRVLPQKGVAGFWQGFENASHNVFVAPGTIRDLARDIPKNAVPPSSLVLVSNRGGVEDAAALSSDVVKSLTSVGILGGVETVKEDLLDAAEAEGKSFQELFLGIGTFAIVAGILLLVNIFVMLADERKSQLGMLRAVGMRRIDLIRAFSIEGSVYAAFASIFGALLGIGVGWAIVKLAAPIFGGFEDFGLDLVFSMDPQSLLDGFTLGLVISLITIVLTSIRISRINIIAAIRDLPAERIRIERKRNVVVGSLIAAAGVAWFISGLQDDQAWLGAELGLPLAFFSLLPITSRSIPRRAAVVLASFLSLVWGIFGNAITGGQFYSSGEINAFVVVGILLTFSAVVLLSQIGDVLEKSFARVGARKLALRLGMSYPLAKRFRTGLTLGMYALVIFTMTFIAVLTEVFGSQVDRVVESASGGYDVLVSTSESNPPSQGDLESIPGVGNATPLLRGLASYEAEGVTEPQAWGAIGINDEFVQSGPPKLEERAPGYGSDEEVWAAVAEDPKLAVISDFFLQTAGGPPSNLIEPGDLFTAIDRSDDRRYEREVAGILSQDLTFSTYMSVESAREILGDKASRSLFFVEAGDSESEAAKVGATLQGELFKNGVEADTFRSIVEEFQGANLQFFRLMQAYLALGLIVGIAGLGVVMVRSVRERRREIGVLRAIGFVAPQVRRAFLSESAFTAFQGIVVGTILALITAAQLVNSGEFGETAEFVIPWADVGILTGAAMVASLLATAWPAHQASTIPPAVALRTAE